MFSEIETKLKVDSLIEIKEKLTELSAEFVEEQNQTDYYFDDHNGTMKANDKCLRIRISACRSQEKLYLTYKGPKERSQIKKRQEIETQVTGNLETMQKLLDALGYEKAYVVEKKRQIYKLDDCEIDLDEVSSLGTFIEIEGKTEETILKVQQKLGLEDYEHISKSYARLLAEKKTHCNEP